MKYLSIKNFSKHQHYKDRRPPWIKLHAEILDDYHFGCLQDASKAHLMLLWVLASKLENKIPYDLAWITKQIQSSSPVDVEELVLQGFIEVSQDDSRPLASRKQSAMPETEAERETEKSKKKPVASSEAKLVVQGGWPSEASEIWGKHVTELDPGRCGASLKRIVAKYGWPKTRDGLLAYIECNEGKARRMEWFADDAVRWIERIGPMKNNDEHGLTERGKLAYAAAQRTA